MELRRFTNQTGLVNFLPLPRSILDQNLSSTAMVLYALLLSRANLSRKNNYVDETGWVYVVYPIEELAHTLHLGNTAVKEALRSLERKGLIHRIRPSRREANRLFIRVPADAVTDALTGGFCVMDRRKTGFSRDEKTARSKRSKIKEIENTYQYSQEESF